jgi:hypothetical protein
MAKRIIYVEPGDHIEVRLCNPESGLGPCAAGWKWSSRPTKWLLGVFNNGIEVPPYLTTRQFGDAT